jgi:hypothetical protein
LIAGKIAALNNRLNSVSLGAGEALHPQAAVSYKPTLTASPSGYRWLYGIRW